MAVVVCDGFVDSTVSLHARRLGLLRSGGPCSPYFVWCFCVSLSKPASDLLRLFLHGRLCATTVHCILEELSVVIGSVKLDKSRFEAGFFAVVGEEFSTRGTLMGKFLFICADFFGA